LPLPAVLGTPPTILLKPLHHKNLSMKSFLLTTLIVILGLPMLAQDIHFPPVIVAAGGSSGGSSATLTRWRLAPIHVISLPDIKSKEKVLTSDVDWSVSIYPNPVKNTLNLEFVLPESKELLIRITDVAGRVVYIQESRSFNNGSIVELNLSEYTPTLYLLQISPPDLSSQKIFRIQKI
jgi:hypothetical protein